MSSKEKIKGNPGQSCDGTLNNTGYSDSLPAILKHSKSCIIYLLETQERTSSHRFVPAKGNL